MGGKGVRRRSRALALLAVLLVPIQASTAGPWVLTSNGLGPLVIGMSRRQAEATLHARLKRDLIFDGSCEEFPVRDLPDLTLMFEHGELTRVTIFAGNRLATSAGVRIGDPESKLRGLYGAALRIEPHAYNEPPAHYLTVSGPAAGRGLKFSTSANGRVEQIDAGRSTSISYIEGCL
jgi:hypothetical protein